MDTGGNLFDLQASLSIDTGDFQNAVSDAIESAGDLQNAISGINDDVSIDVGVNDDGVSEEINNINESLDDIGDVEANINVDGEDAQETAEGVSGAMDGIENVDADIKVDGNDAKETAEGVAGAVGSIEEQSGNASGGISGLADTIINVLGGVAVAGAISGVYNSVKDLVLATTAAGDAIDKQSDQLGLSIKEYQEWDYIMQLCGSDVATMGRMMNKLADPTESVSEAISGLGIDMEEFGKMSRGDQFAAVIEGLQGIEDPTERAAAAQEIFGNQWKNIATLIEQSPEYIDDCKQSMEELGMYMSEDDVSAAASFSDAMTTLNGTIESLKNDIVADILPALTEFFNGISGVIGDIHAIFDKLSDNTVVETMENIGTAFSGTIADINSQELNAQSIIDAMEALGDPDLWDAEDEAEWTALYEQLIGVLPGLANEFGKTGESVKGCTAELREHAKSLVEVARAEAVADAIAKKEAALVEAESEYIDMLADRDTAQRKALTTTKAAAEATNDYLAGLTDSQRAYAEQYVDDSGILDYSGMMSNNYGILDLPEMDESGIASINQAAGAMGELAVAEENLAAKSEEIAEARAATDEWERSIMDIAGIDTSGLDNTAEAFGGLEEGAAAAESSVTGDIGDMTTTVSASLTTLANKAVTECDKFNAAVSGLQSKTVKISIETSGGAEGTPHATGLEYVPYDNYPALLHKGETVLTKLEANNYRKGNGIGGGLTDEAVSAMANVIAGAVASRPLSFGIDGHNVAVRTRNEMSRQTAIRSARVTSGYGKGGVK